MDKPFCPLCERVFDGDFKLCPYDGAELLIRSEESKTDQVYDERYRILHKLGEGGMGAVYKAVQLSTQKPVAIKVVSDRLTENPLTVRRFQREVKLQTKLTHPNIVNLLDFSKTPDGQYYFVMEFVEGKSLRQLIMDEGKLPLHEFYELASQICDGLAYAHLQGVVHRDLKGDNIIIAQMGHQTVVKILDYGLAKAFQEDDSTKSGTELTQQGRAMGTPAYMSPEQAKGEIDRIGPSSDIYSLGVIFFQMLTGHLPFRSDTPWGMMNKHITEPPPPLREENPDAPEELERLIMRCLEKEPEDRFQSTLEIKKELDQVANQMKTVSPLTGQSRLDETIRFRPERRSTAPFIAAAAVALMVAGGLVWTFLKKEPAPEPVKTAVVAPATEPSPAVKKEEPAPTEPMKGTPPEPEPATVDTDAGEARKREIEERAYRLRMEAQAQKEAERAREKARLEERARQQREKEQRELQAEAGAQQEAKARRQAEREKRETIDNLLARAEKDIAADRLTSPRGSNALERYREALALDPQNEKAKAGIGNIVDRYVALADAAMQNNHFGKANALLAKAETVTPGDGRIESARARLKTNKESAEWAGKEKIIRRYIASADRAISSERYVRAIEILNTAESIMPGHEGVRAARNRLKEARLNNMGQKRKLNILSRYLKQANKAMNAGKFKRAEELLDTAETILPNEPIINAARNRLNKKRR